MSLKKSKFGVIQPLVPNAEINGRERVRETRMKWGGGDGCAIKKGKGKYPRYSRRRGKGGLGVIQKYRAGLTPEQKRNKTVCLRFSRRQDHKVKSGRGAVKLARKRGKGACITCGSKNMREGLA